MTCDEMDKHRDTPLSPAPEVTAARAVGAHGSQGRGPKGIRTETQRDTEAAARAEPGARQGGQQGRAVPGTCTESHLIRKTWCSRGSFVHSPMNPSIRPFHRCARSASHAPGLVIGTGDTAKQMKLPVHRREKELGRCMGKSTPGKNSLCKGPGVRNREEASVAGVE